MFKNYLKLIFRTISRRKTISLITVFGLAIGLACCLLIGIFIQHELSYDQLHQDQERIFRVVQSEKGSTGMAWSGPQLGLKMKQDFPQIENMVRVIIGGSGYGSKAYLNYREDETGSEKSFQESRFLYADPDFFQVFSFPLVKGNPEKALNKPGQVVITQSAARKYFGGKDAMGKILYLAGSYPLEVTGITTDAPENSHLSFDFVASLASFYALQGIGGEVNSFWWPPCHTYLRILPDAEPATLEAQLISFSEKYRDADDAARLTLQLQPLEDIWLGPAYTGQQKSGGSITYMYMFSAVALFILLLACINFINLTTAYGAKRAREIGIRKVVGAKKIQLTLQFLLETFFLAVVAFLLALLLVEAFLPFFNQIAEKQLRIPYSKPALWVLSIFLLLITSLAAGIYPAGYLASMRPVWGLYRSELRWSTGSKLRKGLVIFQFFISIVLLTGTVVVFRQLEYSRNVRIGVDQKHIAVISGEGLSTGIQGEGSSRYEVLRNRLLNLSTVKRVAAVSDRPGISSGGQYVWEVEGMPVDPDFQFPVQFVGDDFFSMLRVNMIAGRPLNPESKADIGIASLIPNQQIETLLIEDRAIVINETAARKMGWSPEEAIGKNLRFYIVENEIIYQDYRGKIAGVVEDHHITSIHQPIEPVAYMPLRFPSGDHPALNYLLIEMNPGNLEDNRKLMQAEWQKVVPDKPFQLNYLEDSLNRLYRREVNFGKLIITFTVLAMLIACIGLYGLSAYATETRIKEIGIRKMLGASLFGIAVLFSRNFLAMVGLAMVLAFPAAWFLSRQWLQLFAYQVPVEWWFFAASALVACLVALATVGYHSVKVGRSNPVHCLRSE